MIVAPLLSLAITTSGMVFATPAIGGVPSARVMEAMVPVSATGAVVV
jgi:hypothetical protein